MGKRAIFSAAKKRGITIQSAEHYWTPTPGESVAQWEVQFGPELDDEIEFFESSSEVVAYIEEFELIQPQGANHE